MPLPHVILACDGACRGNPGPGGWGVVLVCGTARKELSGGAPATTNARMELQACLEGLRALRTPCHVTVRSDAQFLIRAFTEGWVTRWQAAGWRKADRHPVEHRDLWEAIQAAATPHVMEWEWVRGHAGDPLNERADALARAASARMAG